MPSGLQPGPLVLRCFLLGQTEPARESTPRPFDRGRVEPCCTLRTSQPNSCDIQLSCTLWNNSKFEHAGPTAPMGVPTLVSRRGQPQQASLADPPLCNPQHLLPPWRANTPLPSTAHVNVVICSHTCALPSLTLSSLHTNTPSGKGMLREGVPETAEHTEYIQRTHSERNGTPVYNCPAHSPAGLAGATLWRHDFTLSHPHATPRTGTAKL